MDRKLTDLQREIIYDWTDTLKRSIRKQIALEQEVYSVPEDKQIMLGSPSVNQYYPEVPHDDIVEGRKEYTKAELAWVRRDALRYANAILATELTKLDTGK